MANKPETPTQKPVLIIGAGISGLLLAQRLRREGIAFRVFERDGDLSTRGVGWGLTLHWSLPALRELLPEDLVQRLPDAYVDRGAVERGALSTFPFFDLSTGELKASTPKAPESQRIRVTRERFRRLLATDINIEWGKSLSELSLGSDGVTATFGDGSTAEGCLIVACDGAQSRARQALHPGQCATFKIPVRVLGAKLQLSPEEMKPIQDLDPFFLQGTSSKDDSFIYLSLLDAPGNNPDSTDKYVCQVCVSWPYREGFLGRPAPTEIPETNVGRHELIETLSENWAEPFRTIVGSIPQDEIIKDLIPQDFPPPDDFHSPGRAVILGDAIHAMAMYRGEGANHAIVDVLDFVNIVLPHLSKVDDDSTLSNALRQLEYAIICRSRPGVLASRRACLDAHDWQRIKSTSPLLTRREMNLQYSEDT